MAMQKNEHPKNDMPVSVCPSGEVFDLPDENEYPAEYEKLKKRVAEQREMGREIVVVMGVGFVGAVMAGVVVLSMRGRLSSDWPAWALLLPVGAAFIRVLAQMFAKIGMESIPSPFFVGLVGYTVSFALAVATHLPRKDKSPIRTPGLKWLVIAGLCYGFAILALNSALACGDLIMVSPIVSCQPLFTLLLGRFVFGEAEIDSRAMLAVALVVPGVILVSLG